MDIIFLHGLKVDCIIGVNDWERLTTQKLHIDIDIGYDLSASGKSDNLSDTLDYSEINQHVVDFCIARKANLVETLADGIASILLNDFNCIWCQVKINKNGAVGNVNDVGVIIERDKN